MPQIKQNKIHNIQAKACSTFCTGILFVCLFAISLLCSCSSKKLLKQGEYVLSDVKITSTSKHFNTSQYKGYLRQHPNAKWFTLFKVPLGIYCWSKADSIKGNKGLSKLWRKIGEAPVVYNSQLTQYSKYNIEQALYSEGYLHANADTLMRRNGHKMHVEYRIQPGPRHYIKQLDFHFDSPVIHEAFLQDSVYTKLRQGMPLNLNILAEERSRTINALHERGFYYLNNDFVTFDIDTIVGELGAKVTMSIKMPEKVDSLRAYVPQRYRNINVHTEKIDGAEQFVQHESAKDTLHYRGINFIYDEKVRINKRVFVSHVAMRPDSLYHETQLQNTYSNLSSLPTVTFTNIRTVPVEGSNDLLDCNIRVKPAKPHTIGLEVEGTNTSGDLGAAMALTYGNRNLFKGSELLSLKLRAAYEAITGLEGYASQNYTEWSAEANLRFPTLLIPFVSIEQKRRIKASSEAKIMYDTQDRPEFHRRILTGAWAYNWSHAQNPRWQHRYDLISVNYVYMPWISDTFRKDYLEGNDPHYSVLRYSYENLFIMKTGYSFVYNSLRSAQSMPSSLYQTNGFQLKCGVELAGNLLYGLSKATKSHRTDGTYNIFGIAYSQYAKFDIDFAKSIVLGEKNSLALHLAFGIGIPYGNSTILPYEKRYFSGGANSVRGWSVRDLGPGSYKGKDGKVDFVNQTGNMKLDLSAEWRTHLFWKLHGAFFLDAGNVWNTRSYPNMEGSVFHFDSFYKQIALAYGLGIRFNFNYFILRFDGGMKAIDPAHPHGRLHFPITKPNFSRDFALHFAVGLPF